MSVETLNRVQTQTLKTLVGGFLEANEQGMATDLLIALEGVVVGTFLMVVHLGGDEPVLDVFVERLRERLAEARLSKLKTAGEA